MCRVCVCRVCVCRAGLGVRGGTAVVLPPEITKDALIQMTDSAPAKPPQTGLSK